MNIPGVSESTIKRHNQKSEYHKGPAIQVYIVIIEKYIHLLCVHRSQHL